MYQLLNDGLNLELAEKEVGKYGKPIIDLIKQSPIILEQSKQDWEYKSLAQIGREEFSYSHLSFWDKVGDVQGRDWFHAAIRELSQNVCRWIYYVDEGLRIYVKTDSGFIPAARDNKDYEFVIRLSQDGSVGDLSFTEPPSWAYNLYLNKKALKTYELFYYDLSGVDADLSKEMKRNAINFYLDNGAFQSVINYEDKPLSPRAENNYLRLIMQLANNIQGFNPKKPFEAAALIKESIDTDLSDKTIANYIQKAYELDSKERE